MFLKKYPKDFNLRRGLSDDTERPMPVKEEFYYLHFLKKRSMPHHAGPHRKHQFCSGGRRREENPNQRLLWPFVGKASLDRLKSSGLASLNNSSKLWAFLSGT